MIRPLIRRLLAATTVAALGVGMLGVTPVSAAIPDWNVSFDRLPPQVAPGNDAGWEVTISNDGSSNINDLVATFTALDTEGVLPTYYSDHTACSDASGLLVCSIGTLASGAAFSVVVAYTVPLDETGFFDLQVELVAGTGNTSADKKGNSRGDAGTFSDGVPIDQDPNFDGGFVPTGGDSFQTNLNLGPRNVQATGLTGADEYVGVMIEDGIKSLEECNSTTGPAECTSLFAEWSRVHVANGERVDTPFKVTMTVRGSAVDGGATEDTIYVAHILDSGDVVIIGDADEETCVFEGGPFPSNADCLTVTHNGNVWIIEVWLLQNGALRGGF